MASPKWRPPSPWGNPESDRELGDRHPLPGLPGLDQEAHEGGAAQEAAIAVASQRAIGSSGTKSPSRLEDARIGMRTEALSEPSYALRFSGDETRIVTLEGTRRFAFDQYRRA